MNQQPVTFTHPACKLMLLSQLRTALRTALPDISVDLLQQKHVRLYRVKDCCQVLYTSGVALQLEKAGTPALEIATAIASNLSALAELTPAKSEDNFTVQVVPPGWIYFHIGELAVAARLQSLAQAPPWWGAGGAGEIPHINLSPPHLFAVQYAHARCCSLVRLAHRQGLISLRESEPHASPPFWSVNTPGPIPWLDANQKLCLAHPAECNLVRSLLQLLDDIYSYSLPRHPITPSPHWEKAALDLSQAFQTFHSRCQIWGKVSETSQAQARIGLVMATQSALWLLLQAGFGVYPLLEL